MKKVVFITGISSGFGLAIARQLAILGHTVYGSSRKEHFGLEGVRVLNLDVTRPEEVDHAVQAIIAREGRLDVLINNAGIGLAGAIEDFSEQEAFAEMNTNFLGTYRCCKAVLPYMRKHKGGTIVTIGSIAGLMGLPFQGFYSASKFALEGLMESLRYEVRPWGIHVVMINPGDFSTGFTANRHLVEHSARSDFNKAFRSTLSVIENDEKSGLSPEILARKVAFVVSAKTPASRYIVASLEQRMAVFFKRLLPPKWFFSVLAHHYKVKGL